ncbi:response regulator transcription factor [Thalassobacillus hwangdonensis]|uniref:Response regulator transcription factor n=1 Tax=Thalassobacillus hwangdonensis TaxID=546108 RepID=A0ABW3L1L9_9BACI
MNHTVAVVEDDPNIQDIVDAYLKREGYEVKVMESAEEAWDLFEQSPPDLWVLDLMLPGMDGYEFCKQVRQTSQVPIIIISAKDDEVDKILGLELGGDDYLTKPFSPRELIARVKRQLKRLEALQPIQSEDSTMESGKLALHLDDRLVHWKGEEIETTTKEFDMLQILVRQPNRAFSREELLMRVWGEDYFGSDRAVDDLVKRLRKKLPDLPLETVWGHGYRLKKEERSS